MVAKEALKHAMLVLDRIRVHLNSVQAKVKRSEEELQPLLKELGHQVEAVTQLFNRDCTLRVLFGSEAALWKEIDAALPLISSTRGLARNVLTEASSRGPESVKHAVQNKLI